MGGLDPIIWHIEVIDGSEGVETKKVGSDLRHPGRN